MKIRRLILAAFVVGFGSVSNVHPNHQIASKAIAGEVNEPSQLRENFRNLFNSITQNEANKVKTYRNILEDETARGQQDFDTAKEELRSARQRHADRQKRFLNKNGDSDGKVTAFKREIRNTNNKSGIGSGHENMEQANEKSSSADVVTTSSIRPVPRAADTFDTIRKSGKVFIDKTHFIKKLLDEDQSRFYFLARPKHFGKSVFLQMLHAFLRGRELRRFQNTSIHARGNTEDRDGFWKEYPVIFLDFLKMTDGTGSLEGLQRQLKRELVNIATEYHLRIEEQHIDIVSLIEGLEKFTRLPVSILVDNYDGPFTSTVLTEETEKQLVHFFSLFYKRIRACSSKLRLVFVTGVTRLRMGDFFHDYKDITHDREFTSILGFTAEDLKQFEPHIEEFAKKDASDYDDKKKCLTEFCGWHRFGTDENTRVLNPGLTCKCVGDYVLENPMTGTEMTSKIANEMKRQNITVNDFQHFVVDLEKVRNGYGCTRKAVPLYTFMLCNGYLTIKQYNNETKTVALGYPSYQVENIIANALSSESIKNMSATTEPSISPEVLRTVREALAQNDMPAFIELLDYYAFRARRQPIFTFPIKPADDRLTFTVRIFTVLRSLFKLRSKKSFHTRIDGVVDIFTREPVICAIRVTYDTPVNNTIRGLMADMQQGSVAFQRSVTEFTEALVNLLAINIKYREDEQRAQIYEWISVPFRGRRLWMNETVASKQGYKMDLMTNQSATEH